MRKTCARLTLSSLLQLKPFQNIGEVRLVVISVRMVSRRKILSRSRDDLNLDEDYKDLSSHHQDDTWYSKEKLYKVGQYLETKSLTNNPSSLSTLGPCGGNIEKMGGH